MFKWFNVCFHRGATKYEIYSFKAQLGPIAKLFWNRILRPVVLIWVKNIYQALNVPAKFDSCLHHFRSCISLLFIKKRSFRPLTRQAKLWCCYVCVLAVCCRDGRQDKSTHLYTIELFCKQAKALFMGLVAVHPQEFCFVFAGLYTF